MNTLIEIAEAIRQRRRSAAEVLEDYIGRIDRHDPLINAFSHKEFGAARLIAADIDRRIQAGEDAGPLAGVPFGVKDLEDCAGMPTGRGCVFYSGGPAARQDGIHVARLRRAGAIPVGKTTTAELGFAGDCHTRACGTTRNPWNPDRTPGGSSGGSAAAVAAGMLPFATGSDGGGSIRGPAAFTGVVGFKSSHGRVPRANGMSENSCLGTLNTTIADTARCLDVMCGPDDRDRMTLPAPGIRYESAIESIDLSGLRVAWSDDLGFAVVDKEVAGIARRAAKTLMAAARLIEVERSARFTNVMPAMKLIYSDLLRKTLERDGFLPDRFEQLADTTKRVLHDVRSVTAQDEFRSRDALVRLEAEVADFFSDADFLLCPATACAAFGAEGPWPTVIDGRDASETMDAPMTPFANYCWNPSISVPAGFTRDGLPVGLLITGRRHRDDQVLRLARIFELSCPWPLTAPLR